MGIELFNAFMWTCEACGRDNFERAITLAPESIDVDDLPSNLDANADPDEIREWIEDGGEGDFVTAPTKVRCERCGATFDVETEKQEDDR